LLVLPLILLLPLLPFASSVSFHLLPLQLLLLELNEEAATSAIDMYP
jgi:hypothetical protein